VLAAALRDFKSKGRTLLSFNVPDVGAVRFIGFLIVLKLLNHDTQEILVGCPAGPRGFRVSCLETGLREIRNDKSQDCLGARQSSSRSPNGRRSTRSRSIVSRVERFRHAEHINECWNRPDPIVLMVQVRPALLCATRQRERRVLTTGAPVSAKEQVNQENQCFAVIQRVVMVSYAFSLRPLFRPRSLNSLTIHI
jgi:hypothetical protein